MGGPGDRVGGKDAANRDTKAGVTKNVRMTSKCSPRSESIHYHRCSSPHMCATRGDVQGCEGRRRTSTTLTLVVSGRAEGHNRSRKTRRDEMREVRKERRKKTRPKGKSNDMPLSFLSPRPPTATAISAPTEHHTPFGNSSRMAVAAHGPEPAANLPYPAHTRRHVPRRRPATTWHRSVT
jgi:hypothetical protein